jgi:hypothetical protein
MGSRPLRQSLRPASPGSIRRRCGARVSTTSRCARRYTGSAPNGAGYTLQQMAVTLCVDVQHSSIAPNAIVQSFPCNGTIAEQWHFDSRWRANDDISV